MKNLILMLLTLPMISLGQGFNSFKSSDVVINHLLGTAIPYLTEKNKTKPKFNYHLNTQESIINWNDKKLIKWGIHNRHEIETISNIQMGSYNDTIHYDKDVDVVFEEGFYNGNDCYFIHMFFNTQDTLRSAGVIIITDDQYEKSKYFWSSDTSVYITLFGSQADSSISFYAGGSMDGRATWLGEIKKAIDSE